MEFHFGNPGGGDVGEGGAIGWVEHDQKDVGFWIGQWSQSFIVVTSSCGVGCDRSSIVCENICQSQCENIAIIMVDIGSSVNRSSSCPSSSIGYGGGVM